MHGVVLDRNRLDRGAIDFSPPRANLPAGIVHAATAPQQTATRSADAATVGSDKVILDCDVPAQAPNLKRIGVAAAGTPRNIVTP